MLTWIQKNKETFILDETCDVVDVNSFSEMPKLAYSIVQSHFHDPSFEKEIEPLCVIINSVEGTAKSYLLLLFEMF